MRHLFLLGSLVGTLTSCTEPPRAHRDGGSDVPQCAQDAEAPECDEASRDNVLFSRARSVCGLLLDCCTVAERSRVAEHLLTRDGLALLTLQEPALLEDPTACRRAVTLSLLSKYQQRYQALDDGRQRFDLAEARQCLSWGQAGASHCAPGLVLLEGEHEPRACQRMFAPNVEVEGDCFEDEDCVAAPDGAASVCERPSALLQDGGLRWALSGRCRPVPAVGEFCAQPESACVGRAYCGADHTCRERLPLDAPCVAAPCDDATFCDATRVPPSCSRRHALFEPCLTGAECALGLGCSDTLKVCLGAPPVSPLDVEFQFCLGDGGTSVARTLPFVPSEGGL